MCTPQGLPVEGAEVARLEGLFDGADVNEIGAFKPIVTGIGMIVCLEAGSVGYL